MTALIRPNGKPYRSRTPVRVEEYVTPDEGTSIVVVGTHDVDVAADLACDAGANHHDYPLPEGVASWWRLVPWNTSGQGDRSWIDDLVRGRPVVRFEAEP
jgi:hypothetical protein